MSNYFPFKSYGKNNFVRIPMENEHFCERWFQEMTNISTTKQDGALKFGSDMGNRKILKVTKFQLHSVYPFKVIRKSSTGGAFMPPPRPL